MNRTIKYRDQLFHQDPLYSHKHRRPKCALALEQIKKCQNVHILTQNFGGL